MPENEPLQEPGNIQSNFVFATVEQKGKIYTDQTGQFPVMSSKGNQYILILYEYDTNAILTEALQNHSATEML